MTDDRRFDRFDDRYEKAVRDMMEELGEQGLDAEEIASLEMGELAEAAACYAAPGKVYGANMDGLRNHFFFSELYPSEVETLPDLRETRPGPPGNVVVHGEHEDGHDRPVGYQARQAEIVRAICLLVLEWGRIEAGVHARASAAADPDVKPEPAEASPGSIEEELRRVRATWEEMPEDDQARLSLDDVINTALVNLRARCMKVSRKDIECAAQRLAAEDTAKASRPESVA